MEVRFPYEERFSPLFGKVKRPVAYVQFWSSKDGRFLEYVLLVDTGADYTLLPRHVSFEIGVNFKKDCKVLLTRGVGGAERVYFMTKGIRAKIGTVEKNIPVGFLEREDIPPLLGRESCLNNFTVCFSNNFTIIKM